MMLTLRVFTPFALGYLLVSIFRSINAVIAPDLVRDLHLSATQLGFAISAFFLGATLLQLPYGVLLDRYDPRRVYAVFLLLCALGTVVTALADGMAMLALGRGLIALGTGASAVTSFKVYAMWFKPERLPMANGLALAAGGLGLMTGTVPVEIALRYVDWRDVHLFVGVLLAGCAALVLTITPAKPSGHGGLTVIGQIKGLGDVLRSLAFWRAAPLMMAVIGGFGALNQLWAGSWVRDVAGLSGPEAANLLLVLTGSMTLSGLLTGSLVALARRVGLTPMAFVVAMAGVHTLVLVVLALEWTPAPVVVFATWALLGFVAGLNFVTYAALAPLFPPQLIGRLNACLTLSWVLGAFLLQNAYGLVLDWFPATNGGYSTEGHRVAVGILVVLVLLALGWYGASSKLAANRRACAAAAD